MLRDVLISEVTVPAAYTRLLKEAWSCMLFQLAHKKEAAVRTGCMHMMITESMELHAILIN